MRIKSRILSLLVAFLFLGAITTSCGKKEKEDTTTEKETDTTTEKETDTTTEKATDTTTEKPEDIVVESASVNKKGKEIPTSLTSIEGVKVADLNGDGKKEIIAVSSKDGKVEILQNYGGGEFTSTVTPVSGAEEVVIGDLNGDGVKDLLVTYAAGKDIKELEVVLNTLPSDNNLLLTNFLKAFGLTTDDVLTKIASLLIIDLDKDGDKDIVAAVTTSDKDDSTEEDKVLIFENKGDTDNNGEPEFPVKPISSDLLGSLTTITELRAADLDNDGDYDLVLAGADSDEKPSVNILTKDNSDNIDDFERFDPEFDFSSFCDDLNSTGDPCEIADFEIVDIEEDGHMDFSFLFEKDDDKSLVFAKKEDSEEFEFKLEDVTPENEDDIDNLSIEDTDGDGDTDLIVATCSGESSSDDEMQLMVNEIIWDTDEDAEELFTYSRFDIPGCDDENENDFEFDLDNFNWFSDDEGCGHQEDDILISNGKEIFLFTDADNSEKDGTPMTADELKKGADAITVIDADGDGNMDLVAATEDGLILLTNNAGDADESTENFTSSVISGDTGLGTLSSLTVFDVDNDGDDDFVASGTKGISTWLNTAGDFVKKNSSILGDIGSKALNFFTTSTGDVDGDGDTDILGTGDIDGDGKKEAVLLENDGKGSFSLKDSIVTTGTSLVKSVFGDMDGDGILDIFTTSEKPDDGGDKNLASSAISLFKGLGNRVFGAEKEIADTPAGCTATDIVPVDVDNDDDDDPVVSDDCGNLTVAKDKGDADAVSEVTVSAEAMGSKEGSPITSLIKTGANAITALVSPKKQGPDGSESESNSSPMDIVKSAVSSDTGKMLVSTATKAIGGLFSNFGSSSEKTTIVETPVEEEKKDEGGFLNTLTSGASKLFSWF